MKAKTLLRPTRWTVRAKSLSSIISNYTYLKELWELVTKSCLNTEMKARIRSVKVYMKRFDYGYGVYLGNLILCQMVTLVKPFKVLSYLQSRGKITQTWRLKC